MRNALAIALFCSLTFLSGCEWFGIREDGTVEPGGGIMGAIGSVVSTVFPGPGTAIAGLIGLATTAGAALRGKRWKDAAVATFQTIEAGASIGKSVKDLKGDLKAAHEKAGVAGVVKKVVDGFGHSKEEAKA